ncbi:unnamed protein product [Protopolystoma xenopodis]|uniref:Uncharacterized protein n=1 Tax=Protopolystoma xenopodis TaxID=117903 RepID=A0A448XM93_9PLAT|nr:unnamed protein product [Protopolystoma xenopodis]
MVQQANITQPRLHWFMDSEMGSGRSRDSYRTPHGGV